MPPLPQHGPRRQSRCSEHLRNPNQREDKSEAAIETSACIRKADQQLRHSSLTTLAHPLHMGLADAEVVSTATQAVQSSRACIESGDRNHRAQLLQELRALGKQADRAVRAECTQPPAQVSPTKVLRRPASPIAPML